MSKALHHPETKTQHGTLASYITGFGLSLAFTLIPYYMVVNKSFNGTALLATILAFAVVQLVVQVVFFLHLGRERQPWNLGFLVATVGAILVVVAGSIFIMNHLHYNMSAIDTTNKIATDEAIHEVSGAQAGTCPGGTGVNHKIELKDGTASPAHTDAQLCDTITIMNEDTAVRDIMFGVHDKHEMYAGEMGKAIRPGRNMLITLTELGTHKFHDHLLDTISGDFTVTR